MPVEKRQNALELRLREIVVRGPIDEAHGTRPKNFDRFFWKDPPAGAKERRQIRRADSQVVQITGQGLGIGKLQMPEHLKSLYAECVPYYEKLHAVRLQSNQ